MGKNNKIYILFEVVLAVIVLIMAVIMLRENHGVNLQKVSVILYNSDDPQWSAFKYGLRMAAQDYGIEVFVVGTGSLLTAEDEQELIDREIENGADAFIVQPMPGDDAKYNLFQTEKRMPVLLAEDTAENADMRSSVPVVSTDHYGMGSTLGEELLKDYNGRIEGKTIGIAYDESGSKAVSERKKGFLEVLEDTEAQVFWTVSCPREEGIEKLLESQQKVDFVIALDDYSLRMAGKCAASNNLHGALVYGIGCSTEAVYYLDTGIARCLIVPDEFQAGYQSLAEIAKSLERASYLPQDWIVSYTVMRRDELFSKENQDILFTMSQ